MNRAVLPDGPTVVRGLSGLGGALADVGYDLAGLRGVLGLGGDISIAVADRIVYELRLAAHPGPLADVAELLALGHAVPRQRIIDALGEQALAVLTDTGAVVSRGDDVVPQLRITPHGDLWIASDLLPGDWLAADPLFVTGINPPATLSANLAVRREVASALDLGTGNGVQAMLASRHCRRVVATDINPRALAFARFNAALNGIDSIEFREGSWFEPVAGERFDLVVSNPPYVISPDNDLVYRDSGAEPGELCARLVADVPGYLTEGGIAIVLASWPITGADWAAVPRQWPSSDCRTWLVQLHVDDPVDHARSWNLPTADQAHRDEYEAAVVRWTDYAREHAITGIGYGALAIVRRTGRHGLVRADTVRRTAGTAGGHIDRVLRNDAVTIDDVAGSVFRMAPGVHLQRDAVPSDDGWCDGTTRLVVTDGLVVDIELDPLMTQVLIVATSGMTVGDAVGHIAAATDLPAAQQDDLLAAACGMIGELFSIGLAEPATEDSP